MQQKEQFMSKYTTSPILYTIDRMCCYSSTCFLMFPDSIILHKILNYSAYTYLVPNKIDFYIFVLQKRLHSLKMFLYIVWDIIYFFRIIISNR